MFFVHNIQCILYTKLSGIIVARLQSGYFYFTAESGNKIVETSLPPTPFLTASALPTYSVAILFSTTNGGG